MLTRINYTAVRTEGENENENENTQKQKKIIRRKGETQVNV